MLDLNNKNTHFLIITAYKSELSEEENEKRNSLLEDSLFMREYRLFKMGGHYKGERENSFLAIKDREVDNNELRYDCIELIDQYDQQSVIVKYLNEKTAKKVHFDGSETPMGLIRYDDSKENDYSYFMDGTVFSFTHVKQYYCPKGKEDLKEGLTVEYLNDNKVWVSKKINNLNEEYENMYRLLIKYNRMRIGI